MSAEVRGGGGEGFQASGPEGSASLPGWLSEAVERFQTEEGRGREEAFRALFRTYFPAVRRFFARKGLAAEDQLDLAQETFLRVYEGLGSFRGEARFDTWMYRIASTTYLKHLRRGRAGKRSGEEIAEEALEDSGRTLFTEPPGQLTDLLAGERRRRLVDAVALLPDQQRRSLLLYVQQGLKYREIAVVMQLSIQTIKAHLFQARQRLRRELGEGFLEEIE